MRIIGAGSIGAEALTVVTNVAAIAAGDWFSMALLSNGTVAA